MSNSIASIKSKAADETAPSEVRAPPADSEEYLALRARTDLREPYKISKNYLHGLKREPLYDVPETPLIAFINARSGGRDGPQLAFALCRALGNQQVFDVSEYPPHKVLPQLWQNLVLNQGDALAEHTRSRIRILVAGGDGTVAWVMKTIKDLDLQPQPAIAIMPLGTGNDLSRTFNWGHRFFSSWIKDHSSIYTTLKRIADAQVDDLDAWRVRVTIPDSSLVGECPHSLHKVQPQQQGCDAAASAAAHITLPTHTEQTAAAGEIEMAGMPPAPPAAPDSTTVTMVNPVAHPASSPASTSAEVLEGMFWNYLSIGMDAEAAHGFHRLREASPHLAASRMANQFWYGYYGCASGWFCCSAPVSQRLALWVQRPGQQGWQQVELPGSVKAVVLVNLQSYAGGRNLWGSTPGGRKGFSAPSHNDGAIEVVGLRSGWHTAAVMGSYGRLLHAKRLAQATAVRMQLRAEPPAADGSHGVAYMQIDGEPWLQPIPGGQGGSPVVVEVGHAGVSKLLLNGGRAKAGTASFGTMVREQRSKQVAAAEKELQQHQQRQKGKEEGLV